MSWKDWLYIPKSDKIAIISLLIIIFLLAITITLLDLRRKENFVINESSEHQQWKAQLIEQKEVEQEFLYEEYRKSSYPFQSKMELGESIELNSADTNQLKTIPGIGSGFANRIVNFRNSLGGYANIEQLNEIWGLDTYLYSQIVPYVRVENKYDSLYINKDSFDKLLRHPYLNYKQVLAIVDIRERKGTIKSIKRLQLLEEFSRKDLEKLSLYASFDE